MEIQKIIPFYGSPILKNWGFSYITFSFLQDDNMRTAAGLPSDIKFSVTLTNNDTNYKASDTVFDFEASFQLIITGYDINGNTVNPDTVGGSVYSNMVVEIDQSVGSPDLPYLGEKKYDAVDLGASPIILKPVASIYRYTGVLVRLGKGTIVEEDRWLWDLTIKSLSLNYTSLE